jgi:hypothetical protein
VHRGRRGAAAGAHASSASHAGTGCIQNQNTTNQKCYWTSPTPDAKTKCPASADDVSQLYGCWGGYFTAGKGRLPYDWWVHMLQQAWLCNSASRSC